MGWGSAGVSELSEAKMVNHSETQIDMYGGWGGREGAWEGRGEEERGRRWVALRRASTGALHSAGAPERTLPF
jgi:hypothetical protein